jgi:hypothetical protein
MKQAMRFSTGVVISWAMLWVGSVLAGGDASDPQNSGSPPVKGLADTRWRLVEFQSMDDATGTTRPSDPSLYTMDLRGDGTVAMRLNCNRATGSWSAMPAGDGTTRVSRWTSASSVSRAAAS